MQRILVYTLMTLSALIGVGMMLSFTAGGVAFGVGFLSAALALWLLYRGVQALELSADLLAQSLLQRSRAKDSSESAPLPSETQSEDVRPAQPAPVGD